MNRRLLSLASFLALGLPAAVQAQSPAAPQAAPSVAAPDTATAAPAADPTDELKALVGRIKAKIQQGKHTAADLADELPAFDALLAKYHDQKTDEVARILYVEGTLYAQVFEDNVKAREFFARLKTDFPATKLGAEADHLIEGLDRDAKAAQTQTELVGKPAPALHFKWSNRDGLKTLADLKGKVIILDFWATWCGPCVASFPEIRALAAHYKDCDVAVVGVTSIQGSVSGLQPAPIDTKGNPDKELALMTDFIKAKDITWSIAVSDEEVFNPDYGIRGIPYMAIIAPDGTLRHTGLHPMMPREEKFQKIDAILKEFDRKLPPAAAPNI